MDMCLLHHPFLPPELIRQRCSVWFGWSWSLQKKCRATVVNLSKGHWATLKPPLAPCFERCCCRPSVGLRLRGAARRSQVNQSKRDLLGWFRRDFPAAELNLEPKNNDMDCIGGMNLRLGDLNQRVFVARKVGFTGPSVSNGL